MRLVELLAKELREWAYHDQVAAQDANGNIYLWSGNPEWVLGAWLETESAEVCGSIFEGRDTLATDHAAAIVTREMWEAERAGLEGQKQWIGEGLPPVGDVCEHQHAGGVNSWYKVRILAHAKIDERYAAVYQSVEDEMKISFSDAVFFRRIDTHTDREKWIEAADKAIGHGLSLHGKLGALYDAGLAKLPE